VGRFVGRIKELAALGQHYATGRFEMVVVYGRRRLGKTMLLTEFSRGKRCLFFTATEKSDAINLSEFSRTVAEFYALPGISFGSWMDALRFVADHANDTAEPLLFIFDEFPYAAKANPSLPSMLQQLIDRRLADVDMTLVLCGSNQGSMENEVLGESSPLYGRRTAQIELHPFDCFDAHLMYPSLDAEQSVAFFATFGGTPYYLAQIRADESYAENVVRLFFDPSGLLYAEPQMLLRQELSEPALYVSVLDAIASGATKPQAISEHSGVERQSVGRYLKTLESLMLIERRVPFGENPAHSRKGIYRIRDPFFSFWYRFVSPYIAAVETGSGRAAAEQLVGSQAFDTYIGDRFEDIAMQWVQRLGARGALGFAPASYGKWWGADPIVHEQADIDIVAADAERRHLLLGECKWRNSFDETQALLTLERRGSILAGSAERSYVLFTKHSVSAATAKKAEARSDLHIVDVQQMFAGECCTDV
jgi:AAA+ ATPase superfamily predicted ATPase